MFLKIKNFLNRINKYSEIIKKIDETLDYKIRSNFLLNSALESDLPITQPVIEGETELIVSFTTFGKRIHDVHLVVETIAQQTIKPNRLLLWLDEKEFNLEIIPRILHKQIKRGLEIRYCPNYKSFKKLIPSLQFFPDATIITIDDDFLYPHDMIEILIHEHKSYPKYILGHRAHKIKLDSKGKLLPYKEWEFETVDSNASDLIFITSGGGTLFPKNCFNNEVFNSNIFFSLCPNADDVWFKAMALLNKVKCKKVTDNRKFLQRFLSIQHSQDIGLFHTNLNASFNDPQIRSVFDKYKLNLG